MGYIDWFGSSFSSFPHNRTLAFDFVCFAACLKIILWLLLLVFVAVAVPGTCLFVILLHGIAE